jgi:shikimate 5-dehydrogenase
MQASKLCVIGYPAKHSLSPKIHGEFIAESGLPLTYTAVEVAPEELADFVAKARKEYLGFNVTMPHKQAIIPLLDELDENARKLNSVNTVLGVGGKLKGYSTDGAGFMRSLKSLPKSALVIGTGGAGTAVTAALADAGVAVAAASRSVKDMVVNPLGFAVHNLENILKHENMSALDMVVNATPLGMENHEQWQNLSWLTRLNPNCVVYDLIYRPAETILLKTARERGLKTENGLPMLLWQAALSFEIWTNRSAPF